MEWAIHATIAAEGMEEGRLPEIFGQQEDFSHFEIGEGLWGGVEVSAPGMVEVYTRSEDLCSVMAVLVEICKRIGRAGMRVTRLSVEAIPLG